MEQVKEAAASFRLEAEGRHAEAGKAAEASGTAAHALSKQDSHAKAATNLS